jgi:iron-sulfur cluster repair protein YtfE (RIC family)
MRRDHLEVVRLTEQLGELRGRLHDGVLDPAGQRELRRVLHGLHAIVSLHFAKEEEVYLPLLDRELTAEEALSLFERMEAVGHTH